MASWKSILPANTNIQSTMPTRFSWVFTVFVVLLSGCTVVGPGFVQPDVPTLSQQYQAKDFQQQPSLGLDSWWQSFADPTLEQLVSQALRNNLTVQIAAERIIEARANVSLNGGSLAPNVTSQTGYEYLKRSPNARPFVGQNGSPFQLFTTGFDSTWEIDLFGRLERSIQAAEAELLAQEYSLQAVQQTLLADVATSYLSVRLIQNQIQTIDHSLMLQEETNQVVGTRADAGVATKLDAEQTQAFLHRSRADKALLELQLNCEFNRLSILLGESPAPLIREFVGVGPIPNVPTIPAAGIPADLIRRRPDIRQAEAVVSAATARIGVAEADLYPTLTLLGSLSLSAQDVSSLFQTDSLAFNVGPSFTWNILHFGRIHDNIEIHESRLRQTAISYRATVLDAVKEVEDAMAKYDGYQKQLVSLESALQSDAKAVELSLQRYKIGKSNFQRVLDSQLQMLQDSQATATARANSNIQLIRLYRAVGGGWPGHAGTTSSCGCAECAGGQMAGGGVGFVTSDVVHSEAAPGGFVNQTSDGVEIQAQPENQSSDVEGVIVETVGNPPAPQKPNANEEEKHNNGKTILQVDDATMPDSGAISTPLQKQIEDNFPTDDFSPIEFVPDFGKSQPQGPGKAVDKGLAIELFGWSQQEAAVVKSMGQSRKSNQRVANADSFGKSQPQGPGKAVDKGLAIELFGWSQQEAAVVKSMGQSRKPNPRVANADYFVESAETNSKQQTQKTSYIRRAATEWVSEAVKDN